MASKSSGDRKRPKTSGGLRLELEATDDICAQLGKIKGDRIVVGFALEDHDHRHHAEAKLRRKRCDAIVLNRVDSLSADATEIEILRSGEGWSGPYEGPKGRLAGHIIDLVEAMAAAP